MKKRKKKYLRETLLYRRSTIALHYVQVHWLIFVEGGRYVEDGASFESDGDLAAYHHFLLLPAEEEEEDKARQLKFPFLCAVRSSVYEI